MIAKLGPRKNTIAIVGIQLGDEGKGRIVDNILQSISNKKINKVYVVRPQGGSNAGHTVEFDDVRIGLHQLPSGIFYKDAIEILDSGMVLHIGDLLEEIKLAEKVAGKLSNRIIVSEDAMLCTDLQRAKEVLNRKINGNSKGGTGRGIGPTTAEFYDKTGNFVKDLAGNRWRSIFSKKYQDFQKIFDAFGENLADYDVPDFALTKQTGKVVNRKVGTELEFLKRLKVERDQVLKLDIVEDTFSLHPQIYKDKSSAVLFEMAQAVGLDPWFGTRPDRTTTPTTAFGITVGTRYWRREDISEVIGVMKATYMSSVGKRTMPTETNDSWGKWVREFAHEYGTTTGRPRDICFIDLPFLKYNIRMSGITKIALTHLDVCQEDQPIKVCVGYKLNGKQADYKPDMDYFSKLTPVYKKLPGWKHKDVMRVKKFEDLPETAKNYVLFLQNELELPIGYITTGPKRENILKM